MKGDQHVMREYEDEAMIPEMSGQDFKDLAERYAKPLLAMAYRYTFDWESAKDVCQDTWLRICEKISIYDGRVPFERWLYAVHRNICLDFLRKRRRRREVVSEAAQTAQDGSVSRETAPDKCAELAQARKRILDAAVKLPDRQRAVFAMIDLEQMTIDEAAGILGIKPVSIRTNLYHARKRIAGILQGSEETT
jgi:RNA polymerase sigma-70 factor (ECF subfamily)